MVMFLSACGAAEEPADAPPTEAQCEDGSASCDDPGDDAPLCGCPLGTPGCDGPLQQRTIVSVDASTGPLLVVSADRHTIATGGGTIQVWAAADGQLLGAWEGLSGALALAISPDGRRVAVSGRGQGDAGTVVVYDVASGDVTHELAFSGQTPVALAFSTDGEMVAVGGDGEGVEVWDLATSAISQVVDTNGGIASAVAFSPDGETLAVGFADGLNGILLWNVPAAEERAVLELPYCCLETWFLSFSADGQRLVSDNAMLDVIVWDVETGASRLIEAEATASGVPTTSGLSLAPAGDVIAVVQGPAIVFVGADDGQTLGKVDLATSSLGFLACGAELANVDMNGTLSVIGREGPPLPTSHCESDADCDGEPCAPSPGECGWEGGELDGGPFCHTALDACKADSDCDGQAECRYNATGYRWACATPACDFE